ncbi:MAG: LysR family transcriptional regulator [Pseudomonadota bacterium]
MLDLQQLRCFVAVAETGSVARAAERLHLSASPLSRQIMALEHRLGLTLFLREGKRLQLSVSGRRFLPQCQSLLAQAARLEAEARDEAQGVAGQLAIAYVDSALFHGVLPRAVQALKGSRPQLRVRLQALRSAEQFAALRRGDIDIAFTHRAPPDGEGLVSQRVAVDPFMLAMPATHPLVGARTLRARDLAQEDFLWVSPTTSPQGHAELVAACQRLGFTPRIQHEVNEPMAALEWVAQGLGLCVVQAALQARAPAQVHMRPLPPAFGLGLELHLCTTTQPGALAAQLWELCPRC